MNRSLDPTDWRILAELQSDGRLSFNELARRVNLSAPAVGERVRRLESDGVIAGYQARIDASRAGLPLTAFVQMRCSLGRCLLKTTEAADIPEVVEIHRLTGNSYYYDGGQAIGQMALHINHYSMQPLVGKTMNLCSHNYS